MDSLVRRPLERNLCVVVAAYGVELFEREPHQQTRLPYVVRWSEAVSLDVERVHIN